MGGLTTTDAVYLALAFVVPGFVLYSVREQFITGRERQAELSLVRCLTYSAVNYAILSAPIYYFSSAEIGLWWKAAGWTSIILVGPVILGVIFGLSVQNDTAIKLLRKIGMNPVHVVPTAWDWKFGRMKCGEWVLATLKDGTQFAGYLGANSFSSSDPKERDLYIQQVFDIGSDQQWTPTEKAVLITAAEIQSIEFWKAEQ